MSFVMKKRVDNLGRIVLPKNMRDYYRISLNDRVNLIPTDAGILITKSDEEDVKNDSAEKETGIG